jgi:hypothetical protein
MKFGVTNIGYLKRCHYLYERKESSFEVQNINKYFSDSKPLSIYSIST